VRSSNSPRNQPGLSPESAPSASGGRKPESSVEIALDFVGWAEARGPRIDARVTEGLTLPQQIPALVELHLEILKPGTLFLGFYLVFLQLGA
jgi:hypothetical protein